LGGFDRNLRAVALSRLVSQRRRMLSSKPRQEVLQRMRELLEAGKVTPVIDWTYPLGEVPPGHPVSSAVSDNVRLVVEVSTRFSWVGVPGRGGL
jgi:NADPH:quinone reductase-like Zn-dependent oxidoreductase